MRTRRWTWRQSELGKITEETTGVLYPIDGFFSVTQAEVLAARDQLAQTARELLGAQVAVGFIHRENPQFEF